MAFREVSVIEVREVLRGWLEGAGLRTVAGRSGVDRKTARPIPCDQPPYPLTIPHHDSWEDAHIGEHPPEPEPGPEPSPSPEPDSHADPPPF